MRKHTNKFLLLLFAIIMTSGIVNGQGFFLELKPGFNFAAGGDVVYKFEITDPDFASYSYQSEVVKGISYGEGLSAGLNTGYMFNENFGAEVGFSYLLGQIGGKNTFTEVDQIIETDGQTERTRELSQWGSMLRIAPGLKVSSSIFGLKPYAGLGLVFGVGKIQFDEQWETIENQEIVQNKWEYEFFGGFSFGYQAKLGVEYELSSPLSFFTEFNMINMGYKPTKGKLTFYTIDGEDQLADMATYEKEIEFVDEDTNNYTITEDENEPVKVLQDSFPMGSMGVYLGVKYTF